MTVTTARYVAANSKCYSGPCAKALCLPQISHSTDNSVMGVNLSRTRVTVALGFICSGAPSSRISHAHKMLDGTLPLHVRHQMRPLANSSKPMPLGYPLPSCVGQFVTSGQPLADFCSKPQPLSSCLNLCLTFKQRYTGKVRLWHEAYDTKTHVLHAKSRSVICVVGRCPAAS